MRRPSIRYASAALLVATAALMSAPGGAAAGDCSKGVSSGVPTESYGGDGRQVMDVYSAGAGSGRPGVILIHGGGWGGGVRNDCRAVYLGHVLASNGIPAFSIEYRKGSPQMWADEPMDVNLALQHVRDNAGRFGVDPARIGVWGHSAGAHLALLAAMKGTGTNWSAYGRFKAVADVSGPTDLISLGAECAAVRCNNGALAASYIQHFEGDCTLLGCSATALVPTGGCNGGALSCIARYNSTSPIHFVDSTDPPTFILHSVNDLLVPFEQALELKALLTANGVVNQMNTPVITPDVTNGHGFDPNLHPEFYARILQFFQDHL